MAMEQQKLDQGISAQAGADEPRVLNSSAAAAEAGDGPRVELGRPPPKQPSRPPSPKEQAKAARVAVHTTHPREASLRFASAGCPANPKQGA